MLKRLTALFRRKDDVERQYPNAPKKHWIEDSVSLSVALVVKPAREAENLYGSTETTGGYVFPKPDGEGEAVLNSNALTADFTAPSTGILSKLLK